MTLEEVRKGFSTWRKTKRYNSEPIPDDLWGQVQSLRSYHNRKEICDTLKINPRQFDLRCGSEKRLPESDPSHAFVAMAVPEEHFSTQARCDVVLQGERRKLCIHISGGLPGVI